MLVNILAGIVGVLLFLFVFWKRLKDDYSSEIIFQVASAILVGLAVGLSASKLLFPVWFFWASFLGVLAGMALMIVKFKLRFYETFEALVLATMPMVALMFFKDSILHSSLNSFLAFVVTLIFIFLSYWFDISYKNFTWYKSGKIGFAGLATGILFLFTRFVIATVGVAMVSFVSKIEAGISGILALTFVGLLINLGRKKE